MRASYDTFCAQVFLRRDVRHSQTVLQVLSGKNQYLAVLMTNPLTQTGAPTKSKNPSNELALSSYHENGLGL